MAAPTPEVSATAILDQQRSIWDTVAASWHRWRATFDTGAARVTERLVELAGLASGQSVLDAGAGLGETAAKAARVVGRSGSVIGVDLSPAMLDLARAEFSAMPNLRFVAGDVTTVDLEPGSFDTVLSRWGLMFVPDREATLIRLAALLRPGGVLAATTWAEPARVPMISLAFRVISEQLELDPPPPGPGPFAMSSPSRVAEELRTAGFTAITTELAQVPFRLASADEYVGFARDVLPPGMRAMLVERCGSVDDPTVWDAVWRAARQYDDGTGALAMSSTCLYVRAVAGGAA